MKFLLALLFALIVVVNSYAQTTVDSIIANFEKTKTIADFHNEATTTIDLFRTMDLNEAQTIMLEVLNHFKRKKDLINTDRFQLIIAYELNNSGDVANALNMSLPILENSIKRKDTVAVLFSFTNISSSYLYSKNYDQAIAILFRSIDYAKAIKLNYYLVTLYLTLADIYTRANQPDSGLVYAQKAMTLAREIDDKISISYAYIAVAENYAVKKDYDLALPYLRKGFDQISISDESKEVLAQVYNDFSQVFLGLKKYDSSDYYARKALKLGNPINYNDQLLRSYEYLYKNFEETNRPDSTYKYYRLANVLKDSLFDIQKIRTVESISFQERLKEQEKEMSLAKAEEERQRTIQFALLAIGIISFVIIFLLLSRSIITSTKVIKFLSVVALLLVFEFLNLALNPFLEKITHRSPILLLLALVCIAGLLAPFHQRIEHWATKKLVEKNKQIRLAAAKKTIERLGADPENQN